MEEENAKFGTQNESSFNREEESKNLANKDMLEPQEAMFKDQEDIQTKGNNFGQDGRSMNDPRNFEQI